MVQLPLACSPFLQDCCVVNAWIWFGIEPRALAFLTDSNEDTATPVGSSLSKIKTAAESLASQASGLFVQSKNQEDRHVEAKA